MNTKNIQVKDSLYYKFLGIKKYEICIQCFKNKKPVKFRSRKSLHKLIIMKYGTRREVIYIQYYLPFTA